MRDAYVVREMPSKELLEDFLRGLSGPVSVQFDAERGVFVRVRPRSAPERPVWSDQDQLAAGV